MAEYAHIFMVDTFHEDQLSVRPLGVSLILKRPTQLLNGDVSFQDLVKSGAGKQAHPRELKTIRCYWRATLPANR